MMRRIADLVGNPFAWAAAIALLFGVPLASGLLRGRAPLPPPVLGAFPAFALRDEQGASLGDRDLRGRAFVAELLCTHCTVPAALAAEAMRVLQRRTCRSRVRAGCWSRARRRERRSSSRPKDRCCWSTPRSASVAPTGAASSTISCATQCWW